MKDTQSLVREYKDKIRFFEKEIEALQASCPHPKGHVTESPWVNANGCYTGWAQRYCDICEKKWNFNVYSR